MREVSCQAVDLFFRALEKKGLDPGILVADTGYPLPHWTNKKERVEWEALVRLHANAAKVWSERELIDMGGAFFRSRFIRSVLLPARLLFRPRDVYRWVYMDPKGLGQQMFPCVRAEYREIGPREANLELSLPDGYTPCPVFFAVTQGAITDLPRILGFAPATVARDPKGAAVTYRIEGALDGKMVARALHGIRARFTAITIAKELKASNEELAEKYRELEDYRLNLEKKVEERTAELVKARDELAGTVRDLKEAQEARDKLFANINHEIRTPLSLVSLAVSDIRARRPDLDERTREQLAGVGAASRQLLRLVDGLLVLAAGQEERLRLRLSNVDVAAQARSAVSVWSTAASARGISLGYDGPQDLIATVDEAALDRILANLLSNALKFTPAGGSVAVELQDTGENAVLAVRDTGVGIDEEFRKRIFGRFEQGRAAVHAGTHGSGVGLSLVRELSRAHGGDVAVETPPSGGSRFVVTLPRKPAPSALAAVVGKGETAPIEHQAPADFGIAEVTAAREEVLEPTGACQGTLLIAEDDPPLRAQLASLLRADYRVLLAPDGITALNLARKHLPDMLVSDIGMPGMDGIELTKRFRDMNGNRLAPVLLLTAFADLRKRMQGFDAGAVDYILKPFEPEELRARVRSQLLLRSLALRLHESEKAVSLGVLSTGLAHELRNPANGIANAIGPLRKLLPPETIREDAPTGQLFKVVEQCAQQLGVLSRQLLGLRSTAAEVDAVETDVADLVSRAQSLASAALSRVQLEKDLRYVGRIACAPSMILQVLANILENAAHAAGKDGRVRISTASENERVIFEIADSGPGVPPELRAKIFEPFFTTKPPGVGTGLGLATAREIVARHAGSIEVHPGSPGAVFRIELPLRPVESSASRRSGT